MSLETVVAKNVLPSPAGPSPKVTYYTVKYLTVTSNSV